MLDLQAISMLGPVFIEHYANLNSDVSAYAGLPGALLSSADTNT
jgi:hypothetical protein